MLSLLNYGAHLQATQRENELEQYSKLAMMKMNKLAVNNLITYDRIAGNII